MSQISNEQKIAVLSHIFFLMEELTDLLEKEKDLKPEVQQVLNMLKHAKGVFRGTEK